MRRRRRRRHACGGGRRPNREEQKHSGQQIKPDDEIDAVGAIAGVFHDKAIDRWAYRGTKVAQAADERDAAGRGTG